MRVLVVEDERMLADAIAEWLRREAFAVDVAYDGDAALERLGVNEYDVVVLDRDLPLVHGDDVCRAVVGSGADTRVLMLTAAAAVRDRVAGLASGRRRLPDQAVRVRRALRPGARAAAAHAAGRTAGAGSGPASGSTRPGARLHATAGASRWPARSSPCWPS